MDISEFKKIGKIVYHNINDHNLFVFPELPSWVVLSDIQSVVFKFLIEYSDIKYIKQECDKLLGTNYNFEQEVKSLSNILLKRKVIPWPKQAFDAPDPDNYPTHIHLCLTHKCNLRCKHCFLSAGDKLDGELSVNEWLDGLSNVLKIIKKPYITVSGGEPTTYNELEKLLSFLKENGCEITLYSNGLNRIDDYIQYIDAVQISLEGISEKTHDFIRGNGVFNRVIKTIKYIPKEKLNIAILIMKHNYKEIKSNLMNFIKKYDIDIDNLRLNAQIEQKGRAITELDRETIEFLNDNADDILKFISLITKTEPRSILKNMRNCGIGISIGIDSDGKIYPCDNFLNPISNIFSENLENELNAAKKINIDTEIKNIEYCRDCDIKFICLGGCKINNMLLNGSYTKPVCSEEDKKIKYIKMIYDCGV